MTRERYKRRMIKAYIIRAALYIAAIFAAILIFFGILPALFESLFADTHIMVVAAHTFGIIAFAIYKLMKWCNDDSRN